MRLFSIINNMNYVYYMNYVHFVILKFFLNLLKY